MYSQHGQDNKKSNIKLKYTRSLIGAMFRISICVGVAVALTVLAGCSQLNP